MLDRGGSSSLPLCWSPWPAIPMPRASAMATGATHRRRNPSVRASKAVNSPVRVNAIVDSGRTKARKWLSWVSPATAKRAAAAKPVAQRMVNRSSGFRLLAKMCHRIPAAIPTSRVPTTTVALLRSASSGERSGSETRATTIAATEPAVTPPDICIAPSPESL